jgi:O-antigen ligase
MKNKIIPLITGIIIILTILILPRQPGEGTKLERDSTIKAKIENYQEGIKTFLSSPVIGHGYDNLFYVRQISTPQSHSNSGFDGSLLTILATTGIIGFCLFFTGSVQLFNRSSLLFQTLLIALFVHSLFANSLLYPWTLVFLILIN